MVTLLPTTTLVSKLHAHLAQVVHLAAHDVLGQAELRDAINEHTAQFVQCLKDGYAVTLLNQVSCDSESGRTAADDGDALARRRIVGGQAKLSAFTLIVGDEALQVADGDRLALLADDASALALVLLRTDSAGDGGQRVVFAHLRRRRQVVARVNQVHNLANLYPYRAGHYAIRLAAGDAACGFESRVLRRQPLVDLFKVVGP